MEDVFVSRPFGVRRSARLAVFPKRRTADLHPRFELLHAVVNATHEAVDVPAAPVAEALTATVTLVGILVRKGGCILGVTDVVELDTVNVVVTDHLVDKREEVVGRSGLSGVEIPAAVVLEAELGVATHNGRSALLAHHLLRSDGEGDEEGVALHAALMALLNHKG